MQIVRGSDIGRYIERLGEFRIEIFSEYPYLYDGELEYERSYLSRYTRSPDSLLIVMEDDQGIIGACTGIPLKYEDEEFKKPFSERNIEEYYYIGEIMLRNDSRGRGLGSALLSEALRAIDTQKYKKVFLCAVDRGENHPLRPKSYFPPDTLWKKFGFDMETDKVIFYHWKDIGEDHSTEKPMKVWVKNLDV